jgi:holo-[acyl-carrier protein] synthase
MIIGIGSDLIDMGRIEKTLERFGDRFINRCFSETEIRKAERRRGAGGHIATYAKRFAAKEACSKALGSGFSSGVHMKDISVENDALGRPVLRLSHGAEKRLRELVPSGMTPHIFLTMTDEPPLAQATVVIEAV